MTIKIYFKTVCISCPGADDGRNYPVGMDAGIARFSGSYKRGAVAKKLACFGSLYGERYQPSQPGFKPWNQGIYEWSLVFYGR